jgi:pyruvate kinase
VPLDPAQSAASLFAFVEKLRGEIVRDGERLLGDWQADAMPEDFLPSARNLAHYLSLRRADLRQIPPGLRALGLSTLGRSEPHVLASVDAVVASLSRIAGRGTPSYPPTTSFTVGSTLLEQRQNCVFGGDPDGPRTRIMATLPSEAADQPALIRGLIAEGADCIRINCAHDGPAAWAAMIAHARGTPRSLSVT